MYNREYITVAHPKGDFQQLIDSFQDKFVFLDARCLPRAIVQNPGFLVLLKEIYQEYKESYLAVPLRCWVDIRKVKNLYDCNNLQYYIQLLSIFDCNEWSLSAQVYLRTYGTVKSNAAPQFCIDFVQQSKLNILDKIS